jgi:hypothetical protein
MRQDAAEHSAATAGCASGGPTNSMTLAGDLSI